MQSRLGPLHAVVLDPHPIWLDAVEVVLGRIGVPVVGKTSSGREALTTVEARKPGLLILELDGLPGEPDGFEVIRRAKALVPSLQAIALSAHHDASHIDGALAAGAAAYVLKTAYPEDVTSAVRQAFGLSVTLAGASRPQTPTVRPLPAMAPDAPGGLTRRELEILRLLADGHSNSQLARMLWVTEQTVKFHLSNIYRKLGVANRTEASRWAQRNGLLSETSEESSVSA
jgi:DNA-binding NarL/FixJ family response regulator